MIFIFWLTLFTCAEIPAQELSSWQPRSTDEDNGSPTLQWATYAYDQVGNQTNQVDALGRVTRFEYDALGRRTREVLPQGQAQGFGYDAVGNLTRHTNFNGTVITNQYDALNRLTNKASAGGYQIRFTYTPTGQRASMVDASGTNTYAYDSRDRLLTNATPQGTLVYTYDLFGNLASIQSLTGGGVNLRYGYDALNRLTNVTDLATGTTNSYGFDAVGNLQTVRYANGVTNRYSYDALNRLTNLVAGTPTAALASFAYRLGPAGNRTNLIENLGGSWRTNAWAYDPLYRLTNEVVTGASPTGTISYRYDAVGNRTNRASTVSGIPNQSFAYTANDWLTSDVYDSNGSTRTNGANVFFYDPENRLTNAVVGSVSITLVYDGDGNRVRKIVGTTTNTYLVDRQNPTGYAQVLEERVNGALSKVYAYGLDLISQREVPSGTTLYFGYDGLGSTRYLTTTNATVANMFVYDAFGTLIASNAAPQTDYLFTGEQRDGHLGLYYLRARYLNPATGRFWTRDTHPGNNQEPLSLHRYLYVHNNPINAVDPSGHEFNVSGLYYSMGARLFVVGMKLSAYPRAMKLAQATATVATLGSMIISDDTRAAYLATGNPAAAAVSLADDVALLVYRAGRLIQQSSSRLARSAVMTRIEPAMSDAARRICGLAPDAVVGYRGSVASGTKYSTQGPFDPTDFDLDGFIVSDQLARQLPPGFRNGRNISELASEADKIENIMQSFSGYRSSHGKEFTFRVWTTEEFERIVKEGPHVTF